MSIVRDDPASLGVLPSAWRSWEPLFSTTRFLHSIAGSVRGVGAIVTYRKAPHVVLGGEPGTRYLLPLKTQGYIIRARHGAISAASRRMPHDELARLLLERYRAAPGDRNLVDILAAYALASGSKVGHLTAAWLVCVGCMATGDRTRIDLRPLAQRIGHGNETVPPLFRWAWECRDAGPIPWCLAPAETEVDHEEAHAIACTHLESMQDALVDAWTNPGMLRRGDIVSVEGERSPRVVVAPIDAELSAYIVVDVGDKVAEVRFPGELTWLRNSDVDPSEPAFAAWDIEATCRLIEAGWLLGSHASPALKRWPAFMATALARHYRCKMAGVAHFGEPRVVFKELQRHFKACDPDDRAKLAAAAPELVNPARRGHPSLKAMDDGVRGTLEALLEEYATALEEEIDAQLHPTPARTCSAQQEDEARPIEAKQGQRNKASRPRVLRAPIHHRDLLALEWPLVSSPTSFSTAITSTLAWLGQRLGTELPSQWADGVHEIELGGVRLEVAANERCFAMRLEHPDAREVARTWRMEATVVRAEVGGMVGLRLSTLDRTELPPAPRTIPALVDAWRQAPGLSVVDGVAEELGVDSSIGVFRLRNEVQDPARKHVIWAFHASDAAAFARIPALVQRCLVAPMQLQEYASKLRPLEPGTWHVFGVGQDAPFIQPVSDAGRHIHGMVAAACAVHGNGPRFRDVLDFARDAMRLERERYRMAAKQQVDQEPSEPLVISSGTMELQRQLDQAIGALEAACLERDAANAETKRLKARLRALSSTAEDASDDDAVDAADFPDDLSSLPDWVPGIGPRVLFADKALREAAKIDHTEPLRIYACLQALHDHYWPMLWADDAGARDRWEAFLAEHRLTFSRVGTALDDRRYADAYHAMVGGKRVPLDMHVSGNSGRNPRRCLRIYLHADAEREVICVGHLPTHLTNSLT